MKKKAGTLLLALCLMLCGCSVHIHISANEYEDGGSYTAGSGEAEGISRIEIEWVAGDIEIRQGTGTKVTFTETANRAMEAEEEMHFLVKNGKLTIHYAKSGKRDIQNLEKKLTVTVPEGATLTELDCGGVSSAMTVEGLSAGEMDLETVSGNIRVKDCRLEELSLEGVSGNMEMEGSTVTRIDLETVSGNTTLRLPKETGFTCKLETVSGTLNTRRPVTKEGNTYTGGDGALRIKAETVSGNITIE